MASILTVPALQVWIQWSISSWYQLGRLGFPQVGFTSVPGPISPAPHLLIGWELTFRLVVTAWLMTLTSNLGSRRPFHWAFLFCRLLIWASCLLILFWCCLEFFDSLLSKSLIWLTLALMPVDVTEDLLCLEHPLNMVTRHPQNLVNSSSFGEDCNMLWAMAALYWSCSLCVYWALSWLLVSKWKDGLHAMIFLANT